MCLVKQSFQFVQLFQGEICAAAARLDRSVSIAFVAFGAQIQGLGACRQAVIAIN